MAAKPQLAPGLSGPFAGQGLGNARGPHQTHGPAPPAFQARQQMVRRAVAT
jgi:hypothetical protein